MILGPKPRTPPERTERTLEDYPGLEQLDRSELDEGPDSVVDDEDWADWEDVSQYRERGKSNGEDSKRAAG